MPKVILQTSLAGPTWSGRKGDTVDLPKATADRLVAAGKAKRVGRPPKAEAETATVEAEETR